MKFLFFVFLIWAGVILIFRCLWILLLKPGLRKFIMHLTTPAPLRKTWPKHSKLYYCNICYIVSGEPGFCNEHGFPNPLRRGKSCELEQYKKLQDNFKSEN
jgi:hypothetical protein